MTGHRPYLPLPTDTDQRFARPRSPPPNSRRSHSSSHQQSHSSSSSHRSSQLPLQSTSSSSSSSAYPPTGPSNSNRSGSPPRHPRDSSSSRSGGKDRFKQNSSSSEAFEKSRWAGTNTTSSITSHSSRNHSGSEPRHGRNNNSGRSGEYRQPSSQSSQSQSQSQQSDRRAPYGERERYRDPDVPVSSQQQQQQQSTPLFNTHRQISHSSTSNNSNNIGGGGGGGPSSSASQHSTPSLSYDQARARDLYNASTRDVASDQIPNALKTADRRESWTRPLPGAPPTGPQNANRYAQQSNPSSNRSPLSHSSSDRYARPPLPPSHSRPSQSDSSRNHSRIDRSRSRSPRPLSTSNPSSSSLHSSSHQHDSSRGRKSEHNKSGSPKRSRSRSQSSTRSTNGDTVSSSRRSSGKKPLALIDAIVVEIEERSPLPSRPLRPPSPSPRAVSRSPRSQSSASSTASPEPSTSTSAQIPILADYKIPEEGEPLIGVDGDEEEVNDRKKRRLPESARSRKEKRLRREEKEGNGNSNRNVDVTISTSIPTGPSSDRFNGQQQPSYSNGSNTPIHSSTPTGPRAFRDKLHIAPTPISISSSTILTASIESPHQNTKMPPISVAPISLLSFATPTGPKSQTLPKFIQSFSSTSNHSSIGTSGNTLAGVPTGPRIVGAGLKKFFPGEDDEAEEDEKAKKEKEKSKGAEKERERESIEGNGGGGRRSGSSRDSKRSSGGGGGGGKKDDRWARPNKDPSVATTSASTSTSSSSTTYQRETWPPTQPSEDSRDEKSNSRNPTRSEDSKASWGREDPKTFNSYDNQTSSKSSSSTSTRSSYPSNYERSHTTTDQQRSNGSSRFTERGVVVPSDYPSGPSADRDRDRDRDRRDRGDRDRRGKFIPPSSDTGYGGATQNDPKFEGSDRNYSKEGRNDETKDKMEVEVAVEVIEVEEKNQVREDAMRPPAIPTPTEVKAEPIPKDTESSVIPGRALIGSEELYERLVQVGEGTYGKVYKARNLESGHLVALKRIRMEAEKDGFPVTAIREIKLLQSLRHPNVVDLIEMMVSKGHVYMVFEYMDHDLTGVLHHPSIQFTPAHLKSFMSQFLLGLGFIHRRGVLHRDLKGSNILIGKNGELKIADFGLARFYARGRNNDYTNRVITQWYKPPELLFGATVYGAEVDMWSAGCIFLELFTRRPIFQGQDEIHQLDVIFKITGTPTEDNWPGVEELPWYELVKPKAVLISQLRETYAKWLTPGGLALVERLLTLDPKGRPTADETLRMDYFTIEEPRPELPVMLSEVQGSWHEYESKRARKRQKEEATEV